MCYGKEMDGMAADKMPGPPGHPAPEQQVTFKRSPHGFNGLGLGSVGNGQYLTEMEKSPGELWLARMMKKPTSLPMSKFSAWCRERPS